jgi:hypothetical protein
MLSVQTWQIACSQYHIRAGTFESEQDIAKAAICCTFVRIQFEPPAKFRGKRICLCFSRFQISNPVSIASYRLRSDLDKA